MGFDTLLHAAYTQIDYHTAVNTRAGRPPATQTAATTNPFFKSIHAE
jgi:hypothetical protein